MKFLLNVFLLLCMVSCKQDNDNNTSGSSDPPVQEEETGTFKNPLLSSGADPWVIQREGTYYYTHTTGNRLDIRATERMENLRDATPYTIWRPEAGQPYSRQIWAPELHYLDGKWYMYFAASHATEENSMDENRRMYVLENSSASPLNKDWVLKGKVADITDKWAIDGTVLEYNDNRYFIWSGWRGDDGETNSGRQQLYIARMSNPWTLEGERVMISEPEYGWERNGLVNEGPVALKNKDGKVYLFYSASGCWTDDYKLGVLILEDGGNPLDPAAWTKHPEPMFTKKPEHHTFGPGHNSFFRSPDGKEDWILYHANANSGEGCGGKRAPRMQKIGWDENGFPMLGEPAPLDERLKIPN